MGAQDVMASILVQCASEIGASGMRLGLIGYIFPNALLNSASIAQQNI